VIFVLDASDQKRLLESKNELVKLLSEKELKDASLLILANKQATHLNTKYGKFLKYD